jgi:ribosomal protein S18 acetylase RimI-like enzyme
MQPEAFAAFLETAAAGYASDNIASGRWLEHEALQLARAETERLLPMGVTTPGHNLFEILANAGGPPVGFLWFAALVRGSRRIAYLYQLEVHPPFRRRGHARAALALMELRALASYVLPHSAELRASVQPKGSHGSSDRLHAKRREATTGL